MDANWVFPLKRRFPSSIQRPGRALSATTLQGSPTNHSMNFAVSSTKASKAQARMDSNLAGRAPTPASFPSTWMASLRSHSSPQAEAMLLATGSAMESKAVQCHS